MRYCALSDASCLAGLLCCDCVSTGVLLLSHPQSIHLYNPLTLGKDEEPEEDEEEEEELETLEEATERLTEEISSKHEEVSDTLEGLSDVFREEMRLPVSTINGNLRRKRAEGVFASALRRFATARGNLLLSPRKVSYEEATLLLQSGRKLLSQFRHWCPVAVHNGAVQPILKGRWVISVLTITDLSWFQVSCRVTTLCVLLRLEREPQHVLRVPLEVPRWQPALPGTVSAGVGRSTPVRQVNSCSKAR